MKPNPILLFCWVAVFQSTLGAEVLPEFAYREVKLTVVGTDGKPVPGASVCGFCPELNLVWPRRERELAGRNDVLWHESFLGVTGANGSTKAVVPPGKWGFFAAGHSAGSNGTIVAVWTDFRQRASGEEIRLAPVVSKHWVLCSAAAAELSPKRIFLKPEGYPVWIPAKAGSVAQIEISGGPFHLWATGDATAGHPAFALQWGVLNERMADGNLLADKPACVECTGDVRQASLFWKCHANYGLEGELSFGGHARVWLPPGIFTLSYRRPVSPRLTGYFVGQTYELRPDRPVSLCMDGRLNPGLDETAVESKRSGQNVLIAQLYLVDGNGHLLAGLFNPSNQPANLDATVTLNGRRFAARPAAHAAKAPDREETEPAVTGKLEQMTFAADLGTTPPAAGAVWEFTIPSGELLPMYLGKSERVRVMSATFHTDVPRVMERVARNLLAEAESLAVVMNNVAGGKRRIENTALTIVPGRSGAISAHNGTGTTIGSLLFFYDTPMLGHTIVHELGHNYGLHHGGLHETVVEVSRSAGAAQISQQPAKWLFLDRMNGLDSKIVPSPNYPNTGLYLYGYAQGGMKFLHFMTANEYPISAHLLKQGYTNDEATAALLGLALGRDMTSICSHYGLSVTAERVSRAAQAARPLLRSQS